MKESKAWTLRLFLYCIWTVGRGAKKLLFALARNNSAKNSVYDSAEGGEHVEDNRTLWQKCRHIFTSYIGCNLLDGVIIGVLNAVFLAATGMPHILPVSVAAGVCNMIPTVGPILGAVIGAALVWPGRPINILWFLLFTAAIQLLDSYLIKPKLFGNTLGVPSLVVLIVSLLGGYFFGVPGFLLAVPAAAIVLMLWREKTSAGKTDREEQPSHAAGTDNTGQTE